MTHTPLRYDPDSIGVSIVHLGPGAFHRAHQAVYTDDLIAKTGGDYGICAISLRSAGLRDALAAQGHIYTLALLDREVSYQDIGAIRESLVAPEDPAAAVARLSDPTIRTVTLTVTEKGYTLGPDGRLDEDHPDIIHDLANPESPRSAVGLIVAGLGARKAAGAGGLDILSCDNLPDNGAKLRGAVLDFAALRDAALADWIEARCTFPSTMVDSITPATDAPLRARVRAATGRDDRWPIQREAFTQWVIEDTPGADLPPWHLVGAELSPDVAAHERAKLRVLNGLHTTLTCFGLLLGLDSVEQAATDPDLRPFLERMAERDILPVLEAAPGQDLPAYTQAIFTRFENPAITHYLSQIFWDTSKKLPIRLLDTAVENRAAGRDASRVAAAVAAWMACAALYAREGREMRDPLADTLLGMGKASADDFLALPGLFPKALLRDAEWTGQVRAAFEALNAGDVRAVLGRE